MLKTQQDRILLIISLGLDVFLLAPYFIYKWVVSFPPVILVKSGGFLWSKKIDDFVDGFPDFSEIYSFYYYINFPPLPFNGGHRVQLALDTPFILIHMICTFLLFVVLRTLLRWIKKGQ